MKIVGFVGSERKNGNTDVLVQHVLDGASSCGIEVEKINLSNYNFVGCSGCEGCKPSFKCVKKDDMRIIYEKLEQADGIVLGSPTYFYNVSATTKAFIDRLYCYDIFSETDRSVWISVNELFGTKYAVTVAICEQNNIEDMGFTSIAMDKALQAVGYRIVESMKVLHMFKKGEVSHYENILIDSFNAGKKLGNTLLLADEFRKKMKFKN
jgi:multimeric flavodoxin WrbA